MVSSHGRYLWSDQPYDVEVRGGVIAVTNAKDDFALYEGYETLRGAFLAAVQAHFPPNGILPPENFFFLALRSLERSDAAFSEKHTYAKRPAESSNPSFKVARVT